MDRVFWRCFHCNATFTKTQERYAREHFGRDETAEPVCMIRAAGEGSLLPMIRKLEGELASYRADDTDYIRAMGEMEAGIAEKLLREEERGYARGVSDAIEMLQPKCMGWGPTRRCGSLVHPGYTRCPSCDMVYSPAALLLAEAIHHARTGPTKADEGVPAAGELCERDAARTDGQPVHPCGP